MSAQGTIVRRRGTHLPMWPVAALLVMAIAAAIGLRVIDGFGQAGSVTTVRQVEGGARAIEDSAPTIGQLPSGPFHAPGRAHEVVLGSRAVAVMPVQRLYPEGFGQVADDESTPIFDGRRRKW